MEKPQYDYAMKWKWILTDMVLTLDLPISLNVVLPKPNLECFKNCFRYAGDKIWNSLPSAFQNAKSIDVFKRMYKDKFFKPV